MKCPVAHTSATQLLSGEFARYPYPDFAILQEQGGVHQVEDLPWYLVTGHQTCVEVLRNPNAFITEHKNFGQALTAIGIAPSPEIYARMKEIGGQRGNMVDTIPHRDGPAHARQRRLVTKAITSQFYKWEGFIEAQTAHLLNCFDGRPKVDAVSEIAVPLPIAVIADILGVANEHLPNIKRWSDDASRTSGRRSSEEDWERQARSMAAMRALFSAEMRKRLEHPSDDLIGSFAAATLEPRDPQSGDEPLGFDEAVELATVLLLAGNETTTQSLASLLYHLAVQPDLLERVRNDESIINKVVEEAVRLASPIVSMMRFCRQETEVAGVVIPAGAIVSVCFNQANRDPKIFGHPDEFDETREKLSQHLAFGNGGHICPGAPLARLEGRILLKQLSRKLKGVRLAGQDAVRYDWASLAVRGMTNLGITYELLDKVRASEQE